MALPRIGFLLGQPTQFEAPFFRHAQGTGKAALTVLYVAADASSSVHDPELGRKVDWAASLGSTVVTRFVATTDALTPNGPSPAIA